MTTEPRHVTFEVTDKMVERASSITDASGSKTECAHHIPRRNFAFLPLAPVMSTTYPKRSPPTSPKIEVLPADIATLYIGEDLESESAQTNDTRPYFPKTRRSSSMSSIESFGRRRFLKLNPVHGGGEVGVPDFTLAD
ncbi:uncharacterized protein BDR25DRAFT_90025 [Lindgomyces ingoldianus]|uniref:Uncharacterized protein n=1 Tax=Lindgomyces ingoldianus TaxID=673940 RepID=A0ACB6RAF8_9PLEO|nr:uncharacterized protein BDR25DRAFT_90025 [Lindgomyces ingoldianus]KAF2476040.1 hypothetical protein BDR25DRAFT_90025 [Lindgomyces ingoldianus]